MKKHGIRNVTLLTQAPTGCVAPETLDAVAVTYAPGLVPALLCGINFARGLAFTLQRPIIPVNHILAHIYACFLDAPDILGSPETYPILGLIISGGHTHLILVDDSGNARVLGMTLDDAAGEAFDKAAKLLQLPYPGGPVIDKLAREGNPKAFAFPRALCNQGGGRKMAPEEKYLFSFSGLKTSLLYLLDPPGEKESAIPQPVPHETLCDLAASYQEAVIDALLIKTGWAIREFRPRTLAACGGVACNSRLRQKASQLAASKNLRFLLPPPALCTDNAIMVAGLAEYLMDCAIPPDAPLDACSRIPFATRLPFCSSVPRR
ncbi:MAG: tRNA (adenosine(37)-N6)-threonylcarbamoyltransferase complex transferase subunit TsaD [Lentisphaerae bacterium]|nr:MAG: tRNA (adenosine(37)-N6)-threonylcarbamoyltransferase complex transferase subunit TsaD [Lentisphaerota bacterium]